MNLLDRLLHAVGLSRTQLRWRLHRLRERSRQRAQDLSNRSRAMTYKHKVCEGCGLTVDAAEKRCPRCGRAVSGMTSRRMRMVWRELVPEGTYTYTSVFAIACVAFYLAMALKGRGTAGIFQAISMTTLESLGAWTSARIIRGEVWRLVTPMFLHFDLLHLIFNCLWIVQLGPLIEKLYGRSRFLVILLISGLAGFAASAGYRCYVVPQPAIGAGASGVVFGLIAVAMVAGYLKKQSGSEVFRSGLVKWALYGVIFSLLPGVDFVAHAGGAVGGGWVALLIKPRATSSRGWLVVEIGCWAVVGVCFALVLRWP
jgi:rhomboid protease GluP